ncbi:MAG: GNAT family N-acetyltransferase [Lachnospiraceae bacterium]|nr:GNAT family N-acetyltransferase [Lachnospiraceae bacterium]
MTMELLEHILEENNIPKDVHIMSDSGWECDATEMDGIFYNRKSNTIIFAQSGASGRGYEESEEWEILYDPDLIKIEELEVYPVFSLMSFGITEEFKKALKAAGDFEQYYGIKETEERYDDIDFQWRPLFYSIKIKGQFIGYIGFRGGDSALEPEIYIFEQLGFHGGDSVLEPEIYIFEQYRNKGYGTKVLKKFIEIAFKDGLRKTWREDTEDQPPFYSIKEETVFPEKLVSTIRVENEYSKKMMLACGFRENKEIAAEFVLWDVENLETDLIQVREFEITKEN